MTGAELLVAWIALSSGNFLYAALFTRNKRRWEQAAGWSWAQALVFLYVYWRMRTG